MSSKFSLLPTDVNIFIKYLVFFTKFWIWITIISHQFLCNSVISSWSDQVMEKNTTRTISTISMPASSSSSSLHRTLSQKSISLTSPTLSRWYWPREVVHACNLQHHSFVSSILVQQERTSALLAAKMGFFSVDRKPLIFQNTKDKIYHLFLLQHLLLLGVLMLELKVYKCY